jgi:TctA family transporter
VLGIPGDTITAIVIGVLYIHGIRPGPNIFNQQTTEIYAIFGTFLLANLLLLPFGWLAIRAMGALLRIPRYVIIPFIFIACVVGAYTANFSAFGIWTMLVFGAVGWSFERLKIPLAPIVLGLILGPPLEQNFVSSLQKYGGDPLGLLGRPVSKFLFALVALLWAIQLVSLLRAYLRQHKKDKKL